MKKLLDYIGEPMERHIQSVIQAVIVVLLIWVGSTLLDVQRSTIAATTSLAQMEIQIREMNVRFNDYPTRNEVSARLEATEAGRRALSDRLGTIESHIK